ncbi:LytR/AlgR family response regulator transcription factor [Sphingobacterium gobiense]|uniref:Response regulatory domain-containing protein n=1 Tax=Sphingobacterium gobiense TaxID=1382456 RepID=A0A2S9JG17_9SPHI|nr:LytTR family DNA-binding domain-containing protein [Sphingobacterium gobiense]PRD51905.1 hypothetical protein C5749_16525 [Sphingobacterium gobiense]
MEKKQHVLRAMVVDDDIQALQYMAELINLTDGIELVVKTTNPRKALAKLRTIPIDVLFLDIEMPIISGLQFMAQLKLLRETNPSISRMQIVVCSAYEHFAVKTYDYKVADYLIKPIFFDRYIEAINEVKRRILPLSLNVLSSDNRCFLIHSERGKIVHRVVFSDIIYLEAREQKSRLWISDTKYYDVHMILKNVLLLLPKSQFVKIHRSYAISISHFDAKVGREVGLKDLSRRLPLGESGTYPLFESWLAENAINGKLVAEIKNNEY